MTCNYAIFMMLLWCSGGCIRAHGFETTQVDRQIMSWPLAYIIQIYIRGD